MPRKRSLKTAARAGAAVAVAGAAAERARRTARSSKTAIAAAGNTTGQAARRVARSSAATVAASAATAGRAAQQISRRTRSGITAAVRAAADDESVWADQDRPGHSPEAAYTRHDALADLANQTERAHQATVAAARTAHAAGATVPEIARAAGEGRHTIKAWLAPETGPDAGASD